MGLSMVRNKSISGLQLSALLKRFFHKKKWEPIAQKKAFRNLAMVATAKFRTSVQTMPAAIKTAEHCIAKNGIIKEHDDSIVAVQRCIFSPPTVLEQVRSLQSARKIVLMVVVQI